MRKKLLKLASAAFAAVLVFSLAACSAKADVSGVNYAASTAAQASETHTHTYSDEWSHDETNHWHASECGHDVVADLSAHVFVNGVCADCGYQLSETVTHVHEYDTNWTHDETNHWHAATCGHDIVKDLTAHVFVDGVCKDCGYIQPESGHVHTYSEEWTYDETNHWRASTCEHDIVTDLSAHDLDENGACKVCGYGSIEGPVDPEPDDPVDIPPEDLVNTTVYFVGDSTVCSFNDPYYLPRYGYGTQLSYYLYSDYVTIENLALSGRSSYSFTLESNYKTLIDNISEGDYLIIGFGHNDEKNEEERYANPNLTYTDETTFAGRPASFQYILYNYYIKVAIDAGATPILCTPIVRLSSSNNYNGSNGHITSDSTTSTGLACPGGDYAQAIRNLGEAVGVDVVDLTALTKADYTELGYAAASDYHAWSKAVWDDKEAGTMTRDGLDATHTNMYGARMNAYYIATELKKLGNSLGDYVRASASKPTKEVYDEAVELAGYVPADVVYAGFDPATSPKSVLGTDITMEGWYGTAFGDTGGGASNFTVSQVGENSIKVGTTATKGKIASTEGIAAAFYQVSITKNFSVSATVTLDNYTATAQTGFGMMLRDDIYIDDTSNTSIVSNYVSAGAYLTSSVTNVIYSRVNGNLVSSGNNETFTAGSTHTLRIERDNQTVRVWFDDYYVVYTDFDFTAIDSDYMYICLYATRETVAVFSDITFEVTGDATIA